MSVIAAAGPRRLASEHHQPKPQETHRRSPALREVARRPTAHPALARRGSENDLFPASAGTRRDPGTHLPDAGDRAGKRRHGDHRHTIPTTTGRDTVPRPFRKNVTIEPAGARFRQVWIEPSALNASGWAELMDTELRKLQSASAACGVSVSRNAAGMLATTGTVRESTRFESVEEKPMAPCAPAAMPNGAWKLICFPLT